MADYSPPIEDLPIFDAIVFTTGDQPLTQNQADKRYLRFPNAQGTENLQAINVNGVADFNANVNIDGITTTTKAIDMIGGSTALNNIATRQLSLKDVATGNNNGSSIVTNNSVLTVDSVGPAATNTITQFALRDTSNTVITPLQLTPTINNMNVSLDMTAPNAPIAPVYSNAIIRGRVHGFRDLNNGSVVNSSLYYTNNNSGFDILNIDSWGPASPTLDGAIFMRTYSTITNSLVIPLYMTKDWIRTNTVLPANDNTNSIPTTAWVQSLISSSGLKRAWKSGNFTGGGGNSACDVTISGCGTGSAIWTQNESLTLRVSYHQQWANSGTSPTVSTIYQSCTADVVLYPWRFTAGWLTQAGAPNGAPRGEINQNLIFATATTTAFAPTDATYLPNGRQFWCNNLNWVSNSPSAPTGRLYISGLSSDINTVRFIVANPYGFSTVPSGVTGTYSFNISVELLNAGDTGATISTSNFTVNF